MNQPLISIIIPTFNRASIMTTAIDSVINQTYKNWECIIVDDGSQDNTISVIENYSKKDIRIKCYQRDRLPKGAPTCRNIGLSNAKGDYVIFLDSDDYFLSFCLEQRVNEIIKRSDNDFLVFPMGELKNNVVQKKIIPFSEDYLINFLSADFPWQTMCPIWKKSILEDLNGFTEGYSRFNDPELTIRALIKNNIKYKVFNEYKYDSVHLPSDKSNIDFKTKVFESLKLFFKDISLAIDDSNEKDKKYLMAGYLHFWFKYIYIPSGEYEIKESLILINYCKNYKIITINKSFNLKLRLLLYCITRIILKKPINKISDKALYIYEN